VTGTLPERSRAVRQALWKVGELAKQTGLSVRTLHWYDEIGLLSPSQHTESGHRLYAAGDVARLQQIKSLRQLGFSLEEIRDCLGRAAFSPRRVIGLHITRLREQIALEQRLCARLEAIAAHLDAAEEVSAEEFLHTIEGMNMVEKYYTPQQLEEFKERAQAFGEDRIRAAEAEWMDLIAQVRAHMQQGTDPASEPVRRIARRWAELIQAFDDVTGNKPEIKEAVQRMWQEEENIMGIDTKEVRAMMEYLGRGSPEAPKLE
jgi:DNA-binding transcriptional MerR regulator